MEKLSDKSSTDYTVVMERGRRGREGRDIRKKQEKKSPELDRSGSDQIVKHSSHSSHNPHTPHTFHTPHNSHAPQTSECFLTPEPGMDQCKPRRRARSLFGGMFGRKEEDLVIPETTLPKHVPSNDDIVRSGHSDFQSLYAANDQVTPSFTVNRLGAPNDSTTMCGCDNTSCPFCNIMTSISNRDSTTDYRELNN